MPVLSRAARTPFGRSTRMMGLAAPALSVSMQAPGCTSFSTLSGNYFNTLSLREQLRQLGQCRFMRRDEFEDGCSFIKDWKIVIVGCGAQGLNQGLNMRDSGLNISYALREAAIAEKRQSWKNARWVAAKMLGLERVVYVVL